MPGQPAVAVPQRNPTNPASKSGAARTRLSHLGASERTRGAAVVGTCVLAVLLGAGLGEDLEVDEAEGHEAEREARHEAREEHEHDDDDDVLEEGRRAAVVLHRHPPPQQRSPAPLSLFRRPGSDDEGHRLTTSHQKLSAPPPPPPAPRPRAIPQFLPS